MRNSISIDCTATVGDRIGLVGGCFGATLLLHGAACGQPVSPAPSQKIDTVIVTAQKRSQSIQKVPMTITALDRRKLRQLGITSSDQLGNYVSNVQISLPSGTGNQPDIAIRGVGLNDYNSNNAGPNGVYNDDVYLSKPSRPSIWIASRC
jgi:iron complex outermembrane receptor protein